MKFVSGLPLISCNFIAAIMHIKLYHRKSRNNYFIEKEIMETFQFMHFEPTDGQIIIRGLECKISKFSKKEEYDEFQFYGLANDFSQNQTSVKSIKITPEFIDLIQNFPSVLYNPTTLSKIKKINMKKALKFEGDEYFKQHKFVKNILNVIFGWFISLFAEINWKMVKSFIQHSENLK